MNRNSTVDRSDVAGAAAIVGGLALLADLGFRAFSGLGGTYFVAAMAMALCLSGAPFGLWAVGAVAPRWRDGMLLGLWGVLWAAVGCGVIAASRSATSRTERAVATDQAHLDEGNDHVGH